MSEIIEESIRDKASEILRTRRLRKVECYE